MSRHDITYGMKVPALLILALAALMCFGCAVGPDYVRPDIQAPKVWNTPLKPGLTTHPEGVQETASWWENLHDPMLTSLIGRSVKGNLDRKEAVSRVREARARRTIARSDLFPTLDASASVQRNRSRGEGHGRTLYAAGFDAGWELDLFGGVRRSIEASEAAIDAADEDLNGVLVSLTAETALNYIEVRTLQSRIDSAHANLKIQEQTYFLEQSRVAAGLSDELSLEQARSNLENTRAQIPNLKTSLEEALNRLAVLLGEQPGAVHEELAPRKPVPEAPAEVFVGVPADALRNRPDVRRSERELAAQTARIGAATADLYPRLSLSGSIGFDALSSGSLFTAGSRSYSYGPRISFPLFNAGSIRANIEVQSVLQEQALIRYEAVVLSALEEVENALSAYGGEKSRQESLARAFESARVAEELARKKYLAGLSSFDTVLDAQRTLNSLQDQLDQSRGAITNNLVRLYKALGGGWKPMSPQERQG